MWYLLIAVVAGVIGFVVYLVATTPSGFPPGTRAFEAQMIMPAIEATLASLRQLQAAAAGADLEKLRRQIAYLENEARKNQAIMAARDLSPGKGYVSYGSLPD
jgi:hypothetical protein